MKVNDKILDSGKLWAMPGGANEVVSWLQKNLNRHGFSLQTGNLVLTGTPLRLHHARPGDRISVIVDDHELVVCLIE